MLNPQIEEFAKVLVQQVRDAAIRGCDRRLRADAKGHVAARWRSMETEDNWKSIAGILIPDIVDKTVCELLRAIDHGQLQISFTASNGKRVDLSEEGLGELVGWYAGIPGWRSKYSDERFIDDYSNPK